MGLFSNNKKLCPICDKPTPRLLATKIEGVPICSDCTGKIDLPDGMLNQMSLDSFREYLAVYDDNKELRDKFTETYSFHLGFLAGYLVIDGAHGLFRLKNWDSAFVMEGANLESFRILEDNKPLYESGNNTLKCYESKVHECVTAMAPQIAQFALQQKEYEMLERIERMQERNNDDKGNSSTYHPRPTFEMVAPVTHFYIEGVLNHPYWKNFRWEVGAPSFDRYNPNAERYLQEYDAKVEELHVLAINLMELVCPGAPEVFEGADAPAATRSAVQEPVQAASEADVIEQLQKYKSLLDAGILTEEEFTAKKRQLLGI